MARILHDIATGDGVLKISLLASIKNAIRRFFCLKEHEEFRVSYVDDAHVFVRNKSRSIAFIYKIGEEEVKKLIPTGVGRVYVTGSYDPRNPRKTFKIRNRLEGKNW